ncbi:MAG TPA: serine hydrolase [Symbiobacteriaceae bacterium]|nr:serine hydrolase [Symbiobacteriaceae bacterium]
MRLWRVVILGCSLAGLVAATTAGVVAVRFTTVRSAPPNEPVRGALVEERAALRAEQVVEHQVVAQERAIWDRSTWEGAAPALRPIEPLRPEPGVVPAPWAPLDQAVREIAGSFAGRLSVVAIDLESGVRYEFRPHDRYLPASTFKLPVTLCTAQAIDRGELTWESLVTFTPADDDTVGQGGFATAPYGGLYPVRNLVDRSLISSNNVAVKMLARTLTWDGLARCTEALGGMVTRTEEGSTPVTAQDEAAWWLALWQMKQAKPALAENLLSPLRRGTYQGRIQAGTPRSDLVTHKFGTFPPYEHDGAIIWSERPYILVVMTYGGDHRTVDGTIEAIAGAAWRAESP